MRLLTTKIRWGKYPPAFRRVPRLTSPPLRGHPATPPTVHSGVRFAHALGGATTLLSWSTTLASRISWTISFLALNSQIFWRVVVWISILVINIFTSYRSRSHLPLYTTTSRVPSSPPLLLERGRMVIIILFSIISFHSDKQLFTIQIYGNGEDNKNNSPCRCSCRSWACCICNNETKL